jgi:hypothetical protein
MLGAGVSATPGRGLHPKVDGPGAAGPPMDGAAEPRARLGQGAVLTSEHRRRAEELRRSGWPVDRMDPQQVLVAHVAESRLPQGSAREPAYTVVGFYGDGHLPYVTTVHTDDGPEAALDLGHKAFEAEGAGGLELQIMELFHDEPRLVDFDAPEGEGR